MNSYNHNHYCINYNSTGWISGFLADTTAISILESFPPEILEIIMYSLQEGYFINCGKNLIKLAGN